MITEIKKEIIYWFWLCVILAWGLIIFDIYDRQARWEDEYQNWEYNLNPQGGNGFYDAMLNPERKGDR